ncbi:MAG TPA: hypothetical protein VK880_02460 [Anaerolineales bacterium]|nr:hypothetical protein [Anaerolineales bacterium]
MTKQEEFFSPSHNRLLSIAVWAKYLAWVALVVFIVNAGLQMFQYRSFLNGTIQPDPNMWLFLRHNPFEVFRLGVDMATTLLRGVIYYLVLKGISLGLNMIVETDINYREREREEVAQ